jgi:hypothetical protein
MTTTTPRPTDPHAHHPAGGARAVLRHWPVAVGLAAAAFSLQGGAEREGVLITLLVACFCYVAAAATGRPWWSWAAIPVGTVVLVASELVGVPWWAGLLTAGAAATVLGTVVAARRAPVARQVGVMAAAGAVVLLALALSPTAALVLGGLALAAHGLWDAWHLARREVVSRSLAVACLALDVPLGLGTVVLALV